MGSAVIVPSTRASSGSADPPALRAGDGVRLKFLYPGGAVEIIDCRWIAVVGLGPNGFEATSHWVVIDFNGREIWKPLGYLAQAELLQGNPEPAMRSDGTFPGASEDIRYHR
jgi:hypothetical protein